MLKCVEPLHNIRVNEVNWHQLRLPKGHGGLCFGEVVGFPHFDLQDLSDDAALKAAQALVGRFGDLWGDP